ncbi:MAG TPA: DUF951 domain-containing protein [Clostridia bacterium]|jgi:hypothetical protein|nr:DUF951 domain-containing protein [Clostridia bacterium]HPZ52762.1 DUF951 domain-containing protein [Clostridia bacterium]
MTVGGYVLKINLGDIIVFKKPHPCGGAEWEVLRTGADFRLKCVKCNHQIMISRHKAAKRIMKIIPRDDQTKNE